VRPLSYTSSGVVESAANTAPQRGGLPMSADAPLEEEYIRLFRKTLATVIDPVAASAATDGEVLYLDPMEVAQGHLESCDDVIASGLRAQARERMLNRTS
jgi:hypothetical protein